MDDMSTDTIEGELSHSRINPIFSPSVHTLVDLYEPIFKPILDPNDPFDAPSPKSHNDPRNSLKYPKHRSHEDYRNDREEQHRQWQESMEHMKNSYAIVKGWMEEDEALALKNFMTPNLLQQRLLQPRKENH